jgi:hypothetical protein
MEWSEPFRMTAHEVTGSTVWRAERDPSGGL